MLSGRSSPLFLFSSQVASLVSFSGNGFSLVDCLVLPRELQPSLAREPTDANLASLSASFAYFAC